MDDAIRAGTTKITGANGDDIEAYVARPEAPSTRGGVVVIHHMPGYDAATKELTRRFATMGYDAVMPNLYWREAPGADPDDAAATARARGGVPDERLVGDVEGAAAYLRDLPSSNGKVGVIGYCSGGRQAFLAATALDLQAAVDCYGAFVVNEPPEGFPVRMRRLVHRVAELRAPLLGLFGNDDRDPTPAEVDELEKLLREHGKTYEFHRYDGAGHGFFYYDRPAYRQQQAMDGWEKVFTFFGKHLQGK